MTEIGKKLIAASLYAAFKGFSYDWDEVLANSQGSEQEKFNAVYELIELSNVGWDNFHIQHAFGFDKDNIIQWRREYEENKSRS